MQTCVDPLGKFMDVTAPVHVEIRIRADGTVIWINAEGCCVFRACRIERLDIVDERELGKWEPIDD